MQKETKDYHSFLLRMWQTTEAGRLTWRASLQDVRSGEIYRFSSMDLLIKFLGERTALLNNVQSYAK